MWRARKRRSWQMLLPHMGERPRLRPRIEKRQRLTLGRGGIDAARPHPCRQTGAAVLLAVPVVHGRQHRFALMHGDDRTFGEHTQVLVGYDRGNFDDEIRVRLQAGHLKIDPNEILGGFHDVYSAEQTRMVSERRS